MEHSLALQHVLLVIAGCCLLVIAARLMGSLARKLGQPAVIGEILAGVLLGPTVLGAIAPRLATALFLPSPGPQARILFWLQEIAVVVFLFVAGTEVKFGRLLAETRKSVGISIAGILFPAIVGFVAAHFGSEVFSHSLAGPAAESNRLVFELFFAVALAISALPVITKTLLDLGLLDSQIGVITISAALIDDIVGWILFAWILAYAGVATGQFDSLLLAFCIVGAFIAGIFIGSRGGFGGRHKIAIERFGYGICAPLFFAMVGLKVDLVRHFDPVLFSVVLIVACCGKIFGCGIAARFMGLTPPNAWSVGLAMNARGAMEIVLGIQALNAGIISEKFFVALVVMALVTSLMSGPMIRWLLGPNAKGRENADA